MAFSDNPRKVHGRVEIVYSDADISREIEFTESGNAEISHPDELIVEDRLPTVKACTMDGNSTMDGTYEIMDDSVRCGWWSNVNANESGTFTTPPYIEIKIKKRPVTDWVILGDEKLGQYPVNFTLAYKRDGATVHTVTITNNTQVRRIVETQLEDITAIRMTISKWSHPNACAKILQFYYSLTEVYEGDALQMFELTEEMCNEEGNYNINADSLTVSIHNKDRKFDTGYLRELMVLDRKLKPYIGVEENGQIRYIGLGTYYSDEWKVSQDSQWVKCNAVDRLLRLQNQIYVGMQLTYDISLYDIAIDIFLKARIPSNEYRVSEALRETIVPTAFMPKQSVWDALQEIANAGLCKIYVDRDDAIVIRCEKDEPETSSLKINPSNMFNYTSNISLIAYANRVAVEYCDVEVTEQEVEAAVVEVAVDPHKSVELTLDYTTEVAYGFMIGTNRNLELTNFNGGVSACTVTVTNNTDTVQTGSLSVFGDAIEVSTKTITVQDEASVRKSGILEYKHPASELVQSQEQAEWIGETLLNKLGAGKGTVDAEWRGDPGLELGEEYEQEDRFGHKDRLICEGCKYTYDGGLRQITRGRKQ